MTVKILILIIVLTAIKPGVCPAIVESTREGATASSIEKCIMACVNDADCVGASKCCYNGCNKTCLPPVLGKCHHLYLMSSVCLRSSYAVTPQSVFEVYSYCSENNSSDYIMLIRSICMKHMLYLSPVGVWCLIPHKWKLDCALSSLIQGDFYLFRVVLQLTHGSLPN